MEKGKGKRKGKRERRGKTDRKRKRRGKGKRKRKRKKEELTWHSKYKLIISSGHYVQHFLLNYIHLVLYLVLM